MEIYLIGIDTSKESFHLCGVNKRGERIYEKKLSRGKLLEYFANQRRTIIAMEVGSGSHYWGREFKKLGYEVRLMAANKVKPYVKSQKNDRRDAEAIAEAALRPNMSFVPVKGEESQDIQNLHRVRERLVAERTALVNQLRGILAEYGIVMPKGFTKMRLLYPIIEEQRERLSELMLSTVNELGEELRLLNQRMKIVETKIELIHKRNPVCQRLSEVPGVGALTSTAIVAAVSDATTFKNGRQFGAWIGLVPRQQSTGGKAKLLGITKKGNPYLRKLLILGARTVISRAKNKLDDRSLWIKETKERIGMNKTAVALANKNARTLWVLLANPDARFKNSFCKEAERLKLAA